MGVGVKGRRLAGGGRDSGWGVGVGGVGAREYMTTEILLSAKLWEQ